jgi:hypothetical protein
MSKKGKSRKLRWLHDVGCIICGNPIDPHDRSWDHFVPQVMSERRNRKYGAGIVFPAHQRCNSARGHQPPSSEMIRRAGQILSAMGTTMLCEAVENINEAEASHRNCLETLDQLRKEVALRLEEMREAAE